MEEEIYYSNKDIILKIVVAVLVISLLLNLFMFIKLKKYKSVLEVTETLLQNEQSRIKKLITEEDITDIKEEEKIFVHISGAIKNPGVYEFSEPTRLFEIIEKAGGTISAADVSSMNLAETIYDETKVHVPKKGESVPVVVVKQNTAGSSQDQSKNSKVNINTASVDKLKTLVGIGDTKAKDIITYRQTNGSFKKIEDIMNVKGIGPSTYDKIKSVIIVK